MLEFLQEYGGPRAKGAMKKLSGSASRIHAQHTFTVPSSSPVAKKWGDMYRTRFIGALSHTQCS